MNRIGKVAALVVTSAGILAGSQFALVGQAMAMDHDFQVRPVFVTKPYESDSQAWQLRPTGNGNIVATPGNHGSDSGQQFLLRPNNDGSFTATPL
jgi:hypothetical protein